MGVRVRISVCVGSIRSDTVPRLVRSIRQQTFCEWELIVVGQGSAEDVEAAVTNGASGDPRVRFLRIPMKGVSRARNAAVREARGDILAFTDDDCEADPSWLDIVYERFLDSPNVGLVGGAVIRPAAPRFGISACPGKVPSEALYQPSAEQDNVPVGWDWIGANFALRREVAEAVGGFDEALGPGTAFGAAEDTDYKLRLEAMRVEMLSTPRSIVHHTFGVRRGMGSVLAMSRNYAAGNGALAGKLTLAGDLRGAEWLRVARQGCSLTQGTAALPRAVRGAYRWRHFRRAYDVCLRDFQISGPFGSLTPRTAIGEQEPDQWILPVVD